MSSKRWEQSPGWAILRNLLNKTPPGKPSITRITSLARIKTFTSIKIIQEQVRNRSGICWIKPSSIFIKSAAKFRLGARYDGKEKRVDEQVWSVSGMKHLFNWETVFVEIVEMYLPRTSSSPEQPVDCSSPNFPAELVVAAVSNWWQQFKSSAASTVSPTIADTAAVVMPCVGRGCCRYRLALLPCCQWRHQCWQWLQSWRSSIVWELVKEFRAVKVQNCETLNKKCQISLTCCDMLWQAKS